MLINCTIMPKEKIIHGDIYLKNKLDSKEYDGSNLKK